MMASQSIHCYSVIEHKFGIGYGKLIYSKFRKIMKAINQPSTSHSLRISEVFITSRLAARSCGEPVRFAAP